MPGPRALAAALALLTLLPAALVPLAEAARIAPMPDLPAPMLNMATVWTGRYVYLFGGRDGDGYRDEILRYDPSTGTTVEVGKLPASSRGPAARQTAVAVWSGSKAYIIGGAVLAAGVPTSIADIVEFDPATNAAQNVQTGVPPQPALLEEPVLGASALWIDGRVWIFGGLKLVITGTASTSTISWQDTVTVFDPTPDLGANPITVSEHRLPYPAQDMAAVLRDGKVLLMGGYANLTHPAGGFEIKQVSSIVEFDPSRETSRVLDLNLPRRLQWAAAGILDETIYLLGGREARAKADGNDELSTSEAIVAWPPGRAPYEHPLTLPIPRYAAGVAQTGESIILLGGRDSTLGQNNPGMSSVYVFTGARGPPTAPQDAKVVQDRRINITWSPPAYDGDAGIDGYRVERRTADGTVAVLARLPATARVLTDRDAPASGDVVYRIIAFNAQGDGPAAAVAAKLGPRPPDAPLRTSAYGGNGEVLLRWTPAATAAEAPVTGYTVQRRIGNATTTFETVDETYLDAGLTNGVEHTYHVLAENRFGVSEPSPPVVVRPRDAPARVGEVATEDTGADVRLTWAAVPGATWYEVLRGTDEVGLVRIANVTSTSAVDASVENGVSYWYAVRAGNDSGGGLPSDAVPVARLTPPTEPYGLDALVARDFVRLQWRPPNATGGVDADDLRYVVRRAREGEVAVAVANDLATTVHTDRTVDTGSVYVYTVQAENLKGLGATSAPLAVATGSDENEPPRAALTAKPAGTAAGVSITFDASFSIDADDAIDEYAFDFGDGETSGWIPSPTVVHAYAANGVYTASVRVRDARGLESEKSGLAQVTIGPRQVEGDNPPPFKGQPEDDDGTAPDVPGDTPGKTPGAGVALVAGVAVAVALARRRRA